MRPIDIDVGMGTIELTDLTCARNGVAYASRIPETDIRDLMHTEIRITRERSAPQRVKEP